MLMPLLIALPLILQSTAPPPNATPSAAPPITMGLWEANITTGMGTKLKTQACMTADSYREELTHIPKGCTISNMQSSSTGMSGDVKCSLANGTTSSGHFDARFPNPSTAHATINVTTTMQGHSVPMTITSDSHFVSADCGDLLPGQSKVVE